LTVLVKHLTKKPIGQSWGKEKQADTCARHFWISRSKWKQESEGSEGIGQGEGFMGQSFFAILLAHAHAFFYVYQANNAYESKLQLV
jgi:hypothetical protein